MGGLFPSSIKEGSTSKRDHHDQWIKMHSTFIKQLIKGSFVYHTLFTKEKKRER